MINADKGILKIFKLNSNCNKLSFKNKINILFNKVFNEEK